MPMSDTLTSILIGILLFGPVIVFFGVIIFKDIKGLIVSLVPKNETVTQVEVFDPTSMEAFALVKSAYDSLTRQHACGYGPWLSSIIDHSIRYDMVKDERGRVRILYDGSCPPSVALAAMFKTRDELTGSRFDLTEVNNAIEILLEM